MLQAGITDRLFRNRRCRLLMEQRLSIPLSSLWWSHKDDGLWCSGVSESHIIYYSYVLLNTFQNHITNYSYVLRYTFQSITVFCFPSSELFKPLKVLYVYSFPQILTSWFYCMAYPLMLIHVYLCANKNGIYGIWGSYGCENVICGLMDCVAVFFLLQGDTV